MTRVDRRVVRLLLADLVSTTGTEMTAVALPWFVLQTTGSAARTGLVLAAELAGLVVCGLPGAWVVQRFGPRRTLLLADGVRVPALLAVPALQSSGLLSLAVLLLVAFVLGAPFAAHQAARQEALVGVVGADEMAMTRVGGLLSAANETASAVGPAIGGVLIALLGASSVLLIDAVSYIGAMTLVMTAVAVTPGGRSKGGRLLDGLRWLWTAADLRRLVTGLCIQGVSFAALLLAIPVLARGTYGGGAPLAGLLLASYGAGSVVGGLVAAAGRALSVGTGVRLMALAHVPVILTPPAAVLGGCLFLHRLGTGLVYPRLFAALAVRPPKPLRASVVTATTTTLSVTGPAGVLAAGALLDGGRSPTAALVMIAATAVFGAVVSGW